MTFIKKILTIATVVFTTYSYGQNNAEIGKYPIEPIPFTAVKVSDQFWAPKIKINLS